MSSSKSTPLSKSMSVEDFEAGYFYAKDLKVFAKELGIQTGNLRKFELEGLIKAYLETGTVPVSSPSLPRQSRTQRDTLAPETVVTNYVGDKTTKAFLLSLVERKATHLKTKSGQWYWLNDWRREQQATKAVFTYQDLADHLLSLMQTKGRLPQIPSARMNNFISDFKADPKNSGVSREAVLSAWAKLKRHKGPKTYAEYVASGLGKIKR